MVRDPAPEAVRRLAEERKAAREARDWPEADRLKAEIEAAGWKVVDGPRGFMLERARPPDVEEDGVVRYGSSVAVPSVLDEPPSGGITVVRAVPDDAPQIGTIRDGRVQTILVANRPTAALPDDDPEVLLLNGWPGTAAALNAGIRRARGAVVAIADPALDVPAGALDALAAALDDPEVAVVGPWGTLSDDLRRFDPAPPGEATAIDGRLLVFRRSDFAELGPLDEGFGDPHRLDAWWSLVLRDRGLDEPPRRAVVVDVGLGPGDATDGGAVRNGEVGAGSGDGHPDADEDDDEGPTAGETRAQRRNFYRLVRAFGGAHHLAAE